MLIATILLAYAPSFTGQFVFDDCGEIATNSALKNLPLWRAMFLGKTLPARPLPYLTFAINYRIHGVDVFGYHAVNLAIHAVATLALFDLVRTTLRSPRLRETFGGRADLLAGIVAAIWAVHPLQTQAVTYVYQRIESMAGMFVLVALAAWARAGASGWNRKYATVAVIASAAAMASKESAVVLPLLAIAYDWTFLGTDEWKTRRPWYAALFATWIILGAMLWMQRGEFQEFEPGAASPIAYLLTQGGVILHYLRLAAWPAWQCIDYGWPIAKDWRAAVPPCLPVFVALVVAILGLIIRKPWAFPAIFFFLTLAPTSSVLPVQAPAVEHRMYLALAGVVSLVVPAVEQSLRRFMPDVAGRVGLSLAVIVIATLALRTSERNRIYSHPQVLWAEAVDRNPRNATARARLAEVMLRSGTSTIDEVLAHAEAAVATNAHCDVYRNLLLSCRRPDSLDIQERIARLGWQHDTDAFGPESQEALDSAGRLITVLRNRGRAEGATLAVELLPAMRRELGPNHLTTLATGVIAAEAALGGGDALEAERRARETWETLMACASRPPALVRRNATVLADSLHRLDRLPEAERVLRFAFNDAARAGADMELPAIAEALADVLAARGSRSEAAATYQRLAAAAKAAGAEDVVQRLAEKIRAVTTGGEKTGE